MPLTATRSIETSRAGQPSPPVLTSVPALRIVPGSWLLEREVSAPDELGWLAEEAQRHVDLLGLTGSGSAVVENAHRAREPFGRLARHPRLVHRAVGVVRSSVAISRVLLTTRTTAPRLDLASGEVAMIVVLRSSAELRRGDILIAKDGEAPPLNLEWPFVVVYRADPTSQLDTENDDCLWPSPWVIAG